MTSPGLFREGATRVRLTRRRRVDWIARVVSNTHDNTIVGRFSEASSYIVRSVERNGPFRLKSKFAPLRRISKANTQSDPSVENGPFRLKPKSAPSDNFPRPIFTPSDSWVENGPS